MAYLGIADNRVAPGKREERKSVGVERTFSDKTNDKDIMDTLADIARELEEDLERLQYSGKTVTVKFKMHTFENKTRAQSVKKWIATSAEILPIAQELLRKELPLRIRLLGIRLSTLKDLTVEEKGIKSFFGEVKKTEISDDDDIVLVEDDFRPPDAPKRKNEEGPLCPICSKALRAKATNQELNDHIDWCLNKDVILQRSPKRAKKDPDKGSVLSWLQKK